MVSHLEIKSSSGIPSHSRFEKVGAACDPQDWSALDRFLRIFDMTKQVQLNFCELLSIKILIRFPIPKTISFLEYKYYEK
jgi:hypothetical protein